jgi:hypothetical protein
MGANQAQPRRYAADAAGGPQISGRAAAGGTAHAVPGNLSRLAIATPDDLSALYRALVDADDRQNALALARLGWVLFTVAITAEEAHRKTAGLLAELQAAASAAYAGAGSPASLELLRHVLARHGWLPEPGKTPLQVFATPPRTRRSSWA